MWSPQLSHCPTSENLMATITMLFLGINTTTLMCLPELQERLPLVLGRPYPRSGTTVLRLMGKEQSTNENEEKNDTF